MKQQNMILTLIKFIILTFLSSILWVSIFIIISPDSDPDSSMPFPSAPIVFGFLTVFLTDFFYRYNNVRKLESRIGASESNIQISQRRNQDLLDKANQLIDKHRLNEKEEILAFAKASSKETTLTSKQPLGSKIETSIEFGQFIDKIPELQANQNVRDLLDEIITSENNLQTYRFQYNQAVEEFNAIINQIPIVFFKKLFGLENKNFFKFD